MKVASAMVLGIGLVVVEVVGIGLGIIYGLVDTVIIVAVGTRRGMVNGKGLRAGRIGIERDNHGTGII